MNEQPNTYPASEEPLIQVFIKKFFPEPIVNDRTVLHKNGKITRNGYEVRVISTQEEMKLKKKEIESLDTEQEKFSIKNIKIGIFKDRYKK